MADFKLQTVALPAVGSPTPIWKDGDTHRQQAPSITIDAISNVFVGDENITGATDALNIVGGCSRNIGNLEIRGTEVNYDLRQIYYLGGPGVLILEVESDR